MDVVGLQEVDKNTERNNYDMLASFAGENGYADYYSQKAIDFSGGEYGIGLLSNKEVPEKTEFDVTVDGEIAATGAYNTKVTIEAPVVEGKEFTGWMLGGNIVSTEPFYTFYIAGDMYFEACYDKVEQVPAAMIAGTQLIKREDGKANMRFVAQLAVPEGYRVLETGLLWLTNDSETVWGTENGIAAGVKKTAAKAMSASGQFSVTIKGAPKGKFIRGVVYAKVTDGSKITWVYSSEKRISHK